MRMSRHLLCSYAPRASLVVACVGLSCTETQDLGKDRPKTGPSAERAGAPRVRSLAPGLGYHSCALFDDERIKCWGRNDYGQLGIGDTEFRGDDPDEMGARLPFVDLGLGSRVKAVSVGTRHTCAVLHDGRVKCWGKNEHGQLGLGDQQARGDQNGEMGDALPSVDLGPGRISLAIACGAEHSCALLDDHEIKCWGNNTGGQLGLEDTTERGVSAGQMGTALPEVDLAGRAAIALSLAGFETCALTGGSEIACWGDNRDGNLGIGNREPRGPYPGDMGPSLQSIRFGAEQIPVQVSVGAHGACAVFASRTIRCWGLNTSGQAGIGTTAYDPGARPNQMSVLPAVSLGAARSASTVSSGGGHACALLDDGAVKCWGYNGGGQLGVGDTRDRGVSPSDMGDALPAVPLGSGRKATAIAAGAEHTCVVLDDASVKCWGAGHDGQLGQGDRANRGASPGEMGDALPPIRLVE
jgi:alpha-tubulin suppressor-like RCC1 family protein